MSLRSHGRYEYVPITRRADYSWPGGKRLAVTTAGAIAAHAAALPAGTVP
jgi:hypothetical protein